MAAMPDIAWLSSGASNEGQAAALKGRHAANYRGSFSGCSGGESDAAQAYEAAAAEAAA